MLVFFTFVILLALTVTNSKQTFVILKKSREDWILDGIGLFFQGIAIPFFQIAVVFQLYQLLLPDTRASLNLYPIAAFLLSFVFVDYLYYWNHRLFHTRKLWFIHQVHHTVTEMDVLGTSRNTLWTSFFIVYLWIHSLFIYLLQEPNWYILGISLSSALDLWRHSSFSPTVNSWLYRCLSPWLILPQDHAWHHSQFIQGNYGANLKLWDKIHKTYHKSDQVPDSLGINSSLSLSKKLFLPLE
ncbi:sterol desaturase family protein [Rivularia sp. UHCC 0363]|uniref:sterol desaturase family protein n=1 Tax=Rivularia sp. UHCC 0363 TaxID=3110244 RepID=UPI002B1EFFC2|nr:sterol desaturase family protein [Rivularia sp. UHCC 0363]MEA5594345.1 sterol desaturase family protein [Rivularia sp. UHCC 0363]